MKAKQYRVLDREEGQEDIVPVETTARTAQGFLQVFFARWPTAPRSKFYAEVGDGRTDIYSKGTQRLVASFIAV